MRYINIKAVDVNDERLYLSVEVTSSKVTSTMKSIINKVCIVVDAWGYGDYEDMYDLRMNMIKEDPTQDMGFAGVIGVIEMSVTLEPVYKVVNSLDEWDEWILEGNEDIEHLVHKAGSKKIDI